uniref:CD276 antigen-like n=1 Tax=Kryptolebias marmoratus TaxID=37003 RepID=A0A3Q3G8N4_KRYMA
MIKVKSFMFLLLLISFFWTFSKGDTEVTCVFSSSCILPCQFQVDSDPVIHWIYISTKEHFIYSYYDHQDQLEDQDQLFRGRTSLFKDQISRGNASLLLRGVKVQDEGRYQCSTSSTEGDKESFINVKIEAPVSEVSISQEGNRITCSSEGIYPEPELTWSTSPPSNMELQNRTRVQQTEEQLYSISSSLMVSDRDPDLIYSCTVRTQRNLKTATLIKPTSINRSKPKTIPCSSSDVPVSNFTWRFNHSQIILTKTEGETSSRVSEEWRKHVEEVSESGSLTLKDLSSTHEGVYTCEARNKEETKNTDTKVITPEVDPGKVVFVVTRVFIFLVIVVGLVIVFRKVKLFSVLIFC